MAVGNAAQVIHGNGRLVVGPTNLSAAYPYGGTEVGKTRLVVLQPSGSTVRVENEALGEASDVLEANNSWLFGCFLRGWDDAAVQHLLAQGYSAGGTTGHAEFRVPSNVPGSSAVTNREKILLYVPDDTVHVPAVLVYRAITDWTEGSQIAWQRGSELGIPVTADCLRDSNGNLLRVARFDDLALS